MHKLSGRCTGGSMDRASDSGSEGWGFESLPVYQRKERIPTRGILSFRLHSVQEGTRTIKSNLPGAGWRRRLDGAEPSSAPIGADVNESLPVYQIKSGDTFWYPHFLFRPPGGKGLERAAPVCGLVQKHAGGMFLARGRVPLISGRTPEGCGLRSARCLRQHRSAGEGWTEPNLYLLP